MYSVEVKVSTDQGLLSEDSIPFLHIHLPIPGKQYSPAFLRRISRNEKNTDTVIDDEDV